MNLSNQDVRLAQGMFVSSATQVHPLGTRGSTADGRVYRYVKAGGADLVAGNVIQSPAIPAGQLTKAINATSAVGLGATLITVTCASSVAAGFYNEGYLIVASGAGQGFLYTINNHPAVSTGASGIFRLYDEDALQVAVTITSTVSLIPNKYGGVIRTPVTTATGVIVGVATYVITSLQFGWIQTWGPCAVLGGDTNALGSPVDGVSSTAGRIRAFVVSSVVPVATTSQTVTGTATGQLIGYLLQTNVDGQWIAVDLTISP